MSAPPPLPQEDLERFRPYLRLLANMHLNGPLRKKFDPSDIVQDTLLEACQDWESFKGTSTGQLAVWLRRILARNLQDAQRRFQLQKRDLNREVSLEASLERSSVLLDRLLADPGITPQKEALRREGGLRLAEAISDLPDAQRDVVILHYLEDRSIEQVATELSRSIFSVAGLLRRALKTLREQLQDRQ